MDMITIYICDDDLLYLQSCKEIIELIKTEYNKELRVKTFQSGESLLFDTAEKINQMDIIIMDMIMKEINGIETSKRLRKNGYQGEIIFLSSSKEYAIESFEVEPLYYVLKDGSYKIKLKEVLLKAISHTENNSKKKMLITTKKRNIVIEFHQILYIECVNKTIFLYKNTGEVEECTTTLGSIEEKIKDHGFIRCHKSFIVNAEYVESFTKTECRLSREIIIPIGRKYANSFKEELMQYELDNIVI